MEAIKYAIRNIKLIFKKIKTNVKFHMQFKKIKNLFHHHKYVYVLLKHVQ